MKVLTDKVDSRRHSPTHALLNVGGFCGRLLAQD